MMMMMGHECERRMVLGEKISDGGKERILRSEEDRYPTHMHIYAHTYIYM
jgi:hypothetical protein